MNTPRLSLLLLLVAFAACKKEDAPDPDPAPTPPAQGVADIDGNYYDTLTIGGLTWFTGNLRTTRFRNGDAIPFDTSNTYWDTSGPRSTVLDHDMANKQVYGLLYNWTAVADTRGICPDGWHASTDDDWKHLEVHLGMDSAEVHANSVSYGGFPGAGPRGTAANVAGQLKALAFWPAIDPAATNSSGMTVLPAGARQPQHGAFLPGDNAFFWTSGTGGWYRQLTEWSAGVVRKSPAQSSDTPGSGYSCRCVKD